MARVPIAPTDKNRRSLLRLCLCDEFCVVNLHIIIVLTNRAILLQKTATAVAYCKRGSGLLKVNGRPLDQIEPKVLQYKLQEPLLLLGKVSRIKPKSVTILIGHTMMITIIPNLKTNENKIVTDCVLS